MAGSITLNKASGGQLTIAPEDGTSTETVSLNRDGFAQSGDLIQEKSSTFIYPSDMYTTSSTRVEISSDLRVTFTPKYSDSTIVLEYSANSMGTNASGITLNIAVVDVNTGSAVLTTGWDTLGRIHQSIANGFNEHATTIKGKANNWGTTSKTLSVYYFQTGTGTIWANYLGGGGCGIFTIKEYKA